MRRLSELKTRGIDISVYKQNIVYNENEKIANLIAANYGCDNLYYESALDGIFPHHRGIANGIKIAIEFAMRKNMIQFVICTSTLAQGVNLPIRYLIVSSIYQANERIKVRDFHNLIGRAGRAGKYTEGTIILSEPFVYSKKDIKDENWKWHEYKQIVNPENSENCLSQLLYLVQGTSFQVYRNENIRLNTYNLSMLKYSDPEEYNRKKGIIIEFIQDKYPKKKEIVTSAIRKMETCLEAIESYLLPFVENEDGNELKDILAFTYGYKLATNEERSKLEDLFTSIM